MPDSNNVAGYKNYKNVWLVSGIPTLIVPAVSRTYAEIFNESLGFIRLGNPSGTVNATNGVGLFSGGYISDFWSSDEWWAFSTLGGSGSVSAFWVEGL